MRQGSRKYSDMGQGFFLNSTCDIAINMRQRHATLAFWIVPLLYSSQQTASHCIYNILTHHLTVNIVFFPYYLYTTYTLFSHSTSQQYSLFHRLTLFQYLIYIINCRPHNPDPTPLFPYACPPPPATTFGHFTMYSIALALISDGRLAYFSSAHPKYRWQPCIVYSIRRTIQNNSFSVIHQVSLLSLF